MKGEVFVRAGRNKWVWMLANIFCCLLLMSCASSDVSRDVASNIDVGVQNASGGFDGASDSALADGYQNSSQAVKGAVLGGAAGAVVGSVSSGIGVLPATAAGAILGASYGSYIDSNTSLKDQLENRGATVVILGDQILIAIPSARLFEPMTAALKPQAYSTLNLVRRFINQYVKILVKVAAYTANSGSLRVDSVLSQQQANNVAKYLQASGIDARLLYAIGNGGTNLVEPNSISWDASDNYRIEITLEKLYV